MVLQYSNGTVCADFPNVVAERHIFRGAHPGRRLWPQNSNSVDICVQYTYPPKFDHHMFTGSEVIVLTNKQTKRRRWKHRTLFATLYDVGQSWFTLPVLETYSGLGVSIL